MGDEPRPIPEILYKYRAVDDFSLAIFSNKEIYFARPDQFNDPFDCGIPIRFDQLTPEQHDEYNIAILVNRLTVPQNDAIRVLELKKKNGTVRTSTDGMAEWQLSHLQKNVRIFCLSAECDNLLMWSHYADYHRGFCIGFDPVQLMESTGAAIGEVLYDDQFPFIHPLPYDVPKHRIQSLVKSKGWKYEKEYRLIKLDGQQPHKINPGAIRSVIFGCKMSPEDQRKLMSAILNDDHLKHLKFYTSEKVPFNFKVEMREIRQAAPAENSGNHPTRNPE